VLGKDFSEIVSSIPENIAVAMSVMKRMEKIDELSLYASYCPADCRRVDIGFES